MPWTRYPRGAGSRRTHEKIAALRAAIAEAHKLGITSLQSVSATDEELELLDEIRKQGDLAVRVYASIAVSPTVTEAAVLELEQTARGISRRSRVEGRRRHGHVPL